MTAHSRKITNVFVSRARRQQRRAEPLRRLRARAGGYFWLPCPMCGESFGGHEWRGRLNIPTGDSTSSGCCRACEADEGARAAVWCRTNGHTPNAVWTGRTGPQTSEGSQHSMGIGFDLSTLPDEYYCSTCFVDLPKDDYQR